MRIPALGTFPTFVTSPLTTKSVPLAVSFSMDHFTFRMSYGVFATLPGDVAHPGKTGPEPLPPGLCGPEVERARGQQEETQHENDERSRP